MGRGMSKDQAIQDPGRQRLTPRQALYYNEHPLEMLDFSEAERADVLAEIERWSEQQTEEQARWLRRRAPRIDVLRIARKAAAAFGD